jgi:hypothetical protein
VLAGAERSNMLNTNRKSQRMPGLTAEAALESKDRRNLCGEFSKKYLDQAFVEPQRERACGFAVGGAIIGIIMGNPILIAGGLAAISSWCGP